jgi:hypothetical protein
LVVKPSEEATFLMGSIWHSMDDNVRHALAAINHFFVDTCSI